MRVAHYLLAVVLGLFVSTITVDGWFFRRTFNRAKNYARDFYGGSRDMWRNYRDMRDANTIGADKYFHSRGNYEAANRGTGGRHAAALISNAREAAQLGTGAFKSAFTDTKWRDVVDDYRADQEANKWGRSGGDPNRYRPDGLDEKY